MRRSALRTTMRSAGRSMPSAGAAEIASACAPTAKSAVRSIGINDLQCMLRGIIAPSARGRRSAWLQCDRFAISRGGGRDQTVIAAGLEFDRQGEAIGRAALADATVDQQHMPARR